MSGDRTYEVTLCRANGLENPVMGGKTSDIPVTEWISAATKNPSFGAGAMLITFTGSMEPIPPGQETTLGEGFSIECPNGEGVDSISTRKIQNDVLYSLTCSQVVQNPVSELKKKIFKLRFIYVF